MVLCAAAPALAQQGTAELGGRVVDAQGGVLPGVTVVITNEDTGVVRELVSGAEGSYFASQIVPGRYRITAKLEGFKALDRRGITLTVGQTTTLDLTMEVGGMAETLTVTGEAPLVDISSAEIGGHISAEELNDLPVGESQLHGVHRQRAGNRLHSERRVPERQLPGQRSADRGQQHRVRRRATTPTTSADRTSAARRAPPTSRSQEVQILTNQFDAEWGRASGAVINAVTKSGTNNFSGSAFNFYTSKGMTNKDFFTKVQGLEKPDVGKKEWGGTIGGPIVQNKLHFFFSLERIAQ